MKRIKSCVRVEMDKRVERLDEILIDTEISMEDYSLVKPGSGKRKLMDYKVKYIRAAIEQHYTYNEIGRNICMTDSRIQHMIDMYGK